MLEESYSEPQEQRLGMSASEYRQDQVGLTGWTSASDSSEGLEFLLGSFWGGTAQLSLYNSGI